jgi:hypothetical protein
MTRGEKSEKKWKNGLLKKVKKSEKSENQSCKKKWKKVKKSENSDIFFTIR